MAGNSFAAGWQQNQFGLWYQNANGTYPCSAWMQDTDGSWYYFNENGYVHTGWLELNGAQYYLDNSGKMLTGQQNIDGANYTFDNVNGNLIPGNEAAAQNVNTQSLEGLYGSHSDSWDACINITRQNDRYYVQGNAVDGYTYHSGAFSGFLTMISDTTGIVTDENNPYYSITLIWITPEHFFASESGTTGGLGITFDSDYFYEGPAENWN